MRRLAFVLALVLADGSRAAERFGCPDMLTANRGRMLAATTDPAGTVHLVSVDGIDGDARLLHWRSDDGGRSFAGPSESPLPDEAVLPSFTVDARGVLHGVWNVGRTLYASMYGQSFVSFRQACTVRAAAAGAHRDRRG